MPNPDATEYGLRQSGSKFRVWMLQQDLIVEILIFQPFKIERQLAFHRTWFDPEYSVKFSESQDLISK
ncbi:MAG: hypothetical protein C4519_27335 [Desulfobacteraceae bacterium]|nr:MAG: hypothetical protein C4519_27335 [Desulfobacteraceae bacterium]